MADFNAFDLDMLYNAIRKNSIGDDIVIFDDINIVPQFEFPYPIDRVVMSLCLQGSAKGIYDMREISVEKNSLLVLIPDHLVSLHDVSSDYKSIHVMLSKSFATSLRRTGSLKAQLHFNTQPVIPLTDSETKILVSMMDMLRYIVQSDNEDKLETTTIAFDLCFRLFNHFEAFRNMPEATKTRQEEVFERFYDLIILHHRQSREVTYYADKLCMTPKYLSSIVKQVTGRSANSWIDKYVILESKALLRTAKHKTIQEIADDMGFVDQATFSKYFKKHTGQNPSSFRES